MSVVQICSSQIICEEFPSSRSTFFTFAFTLTPLRPFILPSSVHLSLLVFSILCLAAVSALRGYQQGVCTVLSQLSGPVQVRQQGFPVRPLCYILAKLLIARWGLRGGGGISLSPLFCLIHTEANTHARAQVAAHGHPHRMTCVH